MSLCATVCLTDVLLMGFGPQWSSEEYDIRLWLHTYTIAVSRITFFVGLGLFFFVFFSPWRAFVVKKKHAADSCHTMGNIYHPPNGIIVSKINRNAASLK